MRSEGGLPRKEVITTSRSLYPSPLNATRGSSFSFFDRSLAFRDAPLVLPVLLLAEMEGPLMVDDDEGQYDAVALPVLADNEARRKGIGGGGAAMRFVTARTHATQVLNGASTPSRSMAPAAPEAPVSLTLVVSSSGRPTCVLPATLPRQPAAQAVAANKATATHEGAPPPRRPEAAAPITGATVTLQPSVDASSDAWTPPKLGAMQTPNAGSNTSHQSAPSHAAEPLTPLPTPRSAMHYLHESIPSSAVLLADEPKATPVRASLIPSVRARPPPPSTHDVSPSAEGSVFRTVRTVQGARSLLLDDDGVVFANQTVLSTSSPRDTIPANPATAARGVMGSYLPDTASQQEVEEVEEEEGRRRRREVSAATEGSPLLVGPMDVLVVGPSSEESPSTPAALAPGAHVLSHGKEPSASSAPAFSRTRKRERNDGDSGTATTHTDDEEEAESDVIVGAAGGVAAPRRSTTHRLAVLEDKGHPVDHHDDDNGVHRPLLLPVATAASAASEGAIVAAFTTDDTPSLSPPRIRQRIPQGPRPPPPPPTNRHGDFALLATAWARRPLLPPPARHHHPTGAAAPSSTPSYLPQTLRVDDHDDEDDDRGDGKHHLHDEPTRGVTPRAAAPTNDPSAATAARTHLDDDDDSDDTADEAEEEGATADGGEVRRRCKAEADISTPRASPPVVTSPAAFVNATGVNTTTAMPPPTLAPRTELYQNPSANRGVAAAAAGTLLADASQASSDNTGDVLLPPAAVWLRRQHPQPCDDKGGARDALPSTTTARRRGVDRHDDDDAASPEGGASRGSATRSRGGAAKSTRRTPTPCAPTLGKGGDMTPLRAGDAVEGKWGGVWYPATVESTEHGGVIVTVRWERGKRETTVLERKYCRFRRTGSGGGRPGRENRGSTARGADATAAAAVFSPQGAATTTTPLHSIHAAVVTPLRRPQVTAVASSASTALEATGNSSTRGRRGSGGGVASAWTTTPLPPPRYGRDAIKTPPQLLLAEEMAADEDDAASAKIAAAAAGDHLRREGTSGRSVGPPAAVQPVATTEGATPGVPRHSDDDAPIIASCVPSRAKAQQNLVEATRLLHSCDPSNKRRDTTIAEPRDGDGDRRPLREACIGFALPAGRHTEERTEEESSTIDVVAAWWRVCEAAGATCHDAGWGAHAGVDSPQLGCGGGNRLFEEEGKPEKGRPLAVATAAAAGGATVYMFLAAGQTVPLGNLPPPWRTAATIDEAWVLQALRKAATRRVEQQQQKPAPLAASMMTTKNEPERHRPAPINVMIQQPLPTAALDSAAATTTATTTEPRWPRVGDWVYYHDGATAAGATRTQMADGPVSRVGRVVAARRRRRGGPVGAALGEGGPSVGSYEYRILPLQEVGTATFRRTVSGASSAAAADVISLRLPVVRTSSPCRSGKADPMNGVGGLDPMRTLADDEPVGDDHGSQWIPLDNILGSTAADEGDTTLEAMADGAAMVRKRPRAGPASDGSHGTWMRSRVYPIVVTRRQLLEHVYILENDDDDRREQRC